jgi:HK97 family phage major capsid protein
MPGPVAGKLTIAFGDFRAGYLINDQLDTRILRDPYTNEPFAIFYATKRVGPGLLDPNAIRLLRVPA